jgi:hypothetical protein
MSAALDKQARELALEISRTCQSETEDAVWFDVLRCTQKLKAFATQVREQTVAECAKVVRTTNVIHGDHYAAYHAPSTDAVELEMAVLRLFPAPPETTEQEER